MPEGEFIDVEIENLPIAEEGDAKFGEKHTVRFSREVYIERDDFMVEPPKKFFRLKPDGEVRLKGAYIVKCVGFKQDESGKVTEIPHRSRQWRSRTSVRCPEATPPEKRSRPPAGIRR